MRPVHCLVPLLAWLLASGCISFKPIRDRNVPEITDEMVELAGQSGDQTLVPALVDLMQARAELGAAGLPDDVAVQAAIALGQLAYPSAEDVLIRSLGDAHGDVRYYAAQSLGMVGDRKAVPPLINIVLSDPDDLLRAQASESLARLTHEKALHIPGDVEGSRANWQRWWAKQQHSTTRATTRPTPPSR